MTLDDEGLRWSASGSERTEARGRWACRCAGMSAAEGDGGGAYRRARNDGQESQGSERRNAKRQGPQRVPRELTRLFCFSLFCFAFCFAFCNEIKGKRQI